MLRNNAILHAAAAALFLAAATPASAENWQAFGADEDGTTAFLDTDSIVASGNVRTFSMKYVVPSIPNVSYTVIRQRVDCAARTVALLHMTAFGAKGEVILDQDTTEPPSPVRPGTKGETVFGKVCQ